MPKDMFDPEQSEVNINTDRQQWKDVYTIQVAFRDLHAMTAKAADRYLKELIAQTIKTAVKSFYPQIQRMVDEEVMKPETRNMIEAEIREATKREIAIHMKEMFGDG